MPPTAGRRNPRNLVAIGLVFVVLGSLQAILTNADALGYGIATAGVLVLAIGAVLWSRSGSGERR